MGLAQIARSWLSLRGLGGGGGLLVAGEARRALEPTSLTAREAFARLQGALGERVLGEGTQKAELMLTKWSRYMVSPQKVVFLKIFKCHSRSCGI